MASVGLGRIPALRYNAWTEAHPSPTADRSEAILVEQDRSRNTSGPSNNTGPFRIAFDQTASEATESIFSHSI